MHDISSIRLLGVNTIDIFFVFVLTLFSITKEVISYRHECGSLSIPSELTADESVYNLPFFLETLTLGARLFR